MSCVPISAMTFNGNQHASNWGISYFGIREKNSLTTSS